MFVAMPISTEQQLDHNSTLICIVGEIRKVSRLRRGERELAIGGRAKFVL